MPGQEKPKAPRKPRRRRKLRVYKIHAPAADIEPTPVLVEVKEWTAHVGTLDDAKRVSISDVAAWLESNGGEGEYVVVDVLGAVTTAQVNAVSATVTV